MGEKMQVLKTKNDTDQIVMCPQCQKRPVEPSANPKRPRTFPNICKYCVKRNWWYRHPDKAKDIKREYYEKKRVNLIGHIYLDDETVGEESVATMTLKQLAKEHGMTRAEMAANLLRESLYYETGIEECLRN
jgi:hypothetical protein